MMTISEYTHAVERLLPPWLPGRAEMIADLRSHLADRVAGGESEAAAIGSMETPAAYAAALVREIPLRPAPLGRRIGAFMIDSVIGVPVLIVSIALVQLVMATFMTYWPQGILQMWAQLALSAAGESMWLLGIVAIFLLAGSALVMSIVYFPFVEAVWGTTIGKKLLGLYVVAENGTRVSWVKAVVRRIPFYFEFFWLDAIFALFTKKRQRAFAHVAGTLVIRRAA